MNNYLFSNVQSKVRVIQRYHQILSTIIKYGFGDWLKGIRAGFYFKLKKKFFRKKIPAHIEKISYQQRIRMICEELGSTFVKFGQSLSMHPEIIPVELAKELEKLQDDVKPLPFSEMEAVIKKELNSSISENFSEFNRIQIASASIAQVYLAKTIDGKKVAVKIQRPNIRDTIKTDINILYNLASLFNRYINNFVDLEKIVKEFEKTIYKELDFKRESRNMEIFRQNFKDCANIYIPEVYWHLSTDKILVMEHIEGIKVSNIERLKEADLDTKEIAINGADMILKQIFDFGFFHADLHSGNIFVMPDNIIALVDFGMMGRIDEQTMSLLGNLIIGITNRDIDYIIKTLSQILSFDESMNIKAFRLDVLDFMDQYLGISLKRIEVGKLIDESLNIARHYKLKFPAELSYLGRTLGMAEAIGTRLYPEFNFIEQIKPYIRHLIYKKISIKKRLWHTSLLLEDTGDLLKKLPTNLEHIIDKTEKGKLKLLLEHQELPRFILDLDKASNRLSFSLIIAAIIVGSSLIMQIHSPPYILNFPAIGIIGYLLSTILGIWLVIAIMRSGKL